MLILLHVYYTSSKVNYAVRPVTHYLKHKIYRTYIWYSSPHFTGKMY